MRCKPTKRRRPRAGDIVTLDTGESIKLTRKGGGRNQTVKRKVREMSEQMRNQQMLKFYLQGCAQEDIASKFGLDQSTVSRAIQAEWERTRPEREQVIEQARELAVAQSYQHIANHAEKASTDPRASELILAWSSRIDRVLGLNVQRTELSGPHGGPIRAAPAPDLSRLSVAKVKLIELLLLEAAGEAPVDGAPTLPAVLESVLAESTVPTALLESDSTLADALAEEPPA